jgi:hypothetical protein
LHGGTRLADLVEKNRAAVSGLKKTVAGFRGAGEGAFDIAKQLAFLQR